MFDSDIIYYVKGIVLASIKSDENQKYAAFLFHMYQPPWQYASVIEQIHKECYSWLTKWLAETKGFKATLNLNYSVVELLQKHRLDDVIENVGIGLQSGSIELTGTAAYHALLPLIPLDEAKRQIERNHRGNEKVFGSLWKPKGFFPPEMAFSSSIADLVKNTGYEWTITDATVYAAHNSDSIPYDRVAIINGLPIFFRSDHWSNKLSMENPNNGNHNNADFVVQLSEGLSCWFQKGYIILSFDIETIGHHHKAYTEECMDTLVEKMTELRIKPAQVSDLLRIFPKRTKLEEPQKYRGSWSTPILDICGNIPYPLWNHPSNPVHKKQWEFANYAIKVINESKGHAGYDRARDLLDKALNSCQFWWADSGRFRSSLVLEGALGLYTAIAAIACNAHNDEQILSTAKQLYFEILSEVGRKDNEILLRSRLR